MSELTDDTIIITLFSELFAAEQKMRQRLSRALPYEMELSHFMLLNYLSTQNREMSPAQLARTFNLTKGAMTNTLTKLESAGYIHIRPDWDDARKKLVGISDAGDRVRDDALLAIMPVFDEILPSFDEAEMKNGLRFMRKLRQSLG